MRSDRRKQIMTLSILIVGVLVISIGFAAFSSILKIGANTTVISNPDLFIVKFSTKNGSKATTGTVTPTKYPSTETSNSSNTIEASSVTVDGSTTLTGLSATFISPGDYVTYKLYAVNEGAYTAYLNSVNFLGSKTCTAEEYATDSLVQAACNGISVSVSVGGTSYSATTTLTGHGLTKETGEEILVTLKYDSNASRADGPFSVEFGDISLLYSTADYGSEDTPGTGGGTSSVCTLADADSDGTADVGEIVTCGTGDTAQRFYVMPDHENAGSNTVSMLAEYNITTTANPVQDPTDTGDPSTNGVILSEEVYWDNRDIEFIYDDRASISTYVNAYKSTLVGMGVSEDIVVTLPSYQQLDDSRVGCSDYDDFGMRICTGPSWVYSTSYWLGSSVCYATGIPDACEVWNVASSGYFAASNDYIFNSDYGVRPIVIISEDDLG